MKQPFEVYRINHAADQCDYLGCTVASIRAIQQFNLPKTFASPKKTCPRLSTQMNLTIVAGNLGRRRKAALP